MVAILSGRLFPQDGFMSKRPMRQEHSTDQAWFRRAPVVVMSLTPCPLCGANANLVLSRQGGSHQTVGWLAHVRRPFRCSCDACSNGFVVGRLNGRQLTTILRSGGRLDDDQLTDLIRSSVETQVQHPNWNGLSDRVQEVINDMPLTGRNGER
jgi:hypothetical protein